MIYLLARIARDSLWKTVSDAVCLQRYPSSASKCWPCPPTVKGNAPPSCTPSCQTEPPLSYSRGSSQLLRLQTGGSQSRRRGIRWTTFGASTPETCSACARQMGSLSSWDLVTPPLLPPPPFFPSEIHARPFIDHADPCKPNVHMSTLIAANVYCPEDFVILSQTWQLRLTLFLPHFDIPIPLNLAGKRIFSKCIVLKTKLSMVCRWSRVCVPGRHPGPKSTA